jgi:hypothetical protein
MLPIESEPRPLRRGESSASLVVVVVVFFPIHLAAPLLGVTDLV